MSDHLQANATVLLNQWQEGDTQALDLLIPLVYQELRQLARAQLRREAKAQIQCTELISEAYLKLVDGVNIKWQDRAHFFSIAARTMRRVLIEQYRSRNTEKRGNNQTLLTYVDGTSSADGQTVELDKLDDALTELEQLDARQAEIVMLRFFGGMTSAEIAEVLDVSERTVKREWAAARLWLHQGMNIS